ncbi:MAG: agmatine deiminase family protein [Candidatus Krumholzibacteria bacterium]|nr:agmatine deiminase family protein [Candidatus Krumholzibacteria bacterium]
MRTLFCLIVASLVAMSSIAAATSIPGLAEEAREWDVDGLEPLLPHHETVAERLYWQANPHLLPERDSRDDPPPAAPVRNCAEWEPCTGVLIRYPLGLPYNLLRDFDDDVFLHVIVSSSYVSQAQTNLAANGVDMARVQFLIRPNDSIWTRDYGPWFVFDGQGQLAIINHTYNRPQRPNDNLIPLYFAQDIGVPCHSHSMYHTGGNYMTDGAHIACSTRLVYDEAQTYNSMNQTAVNQLMGDYYGIEDYQVMDYIESGGIHHIDTWAKWLDEETVLVKDVWPTHGTYAPLNQRATLMASLQASTGRNYRVFRVYCYNIGSNNPASYTNSLILNRNIYVPLFGNSTYDQDALAVYRAAAPGYLVRGYTYAGFLSDDALHCRAKGVMDTGMLRVAHTPVLADQPADPVEITAHIRPHSGAALTSAVVRWRHGAGPWQETALEPAGDPWSYTAAIPAPAISDSTHYYIAAYDQSGRSTGMPRVAPAHWYRFFHAGGPTSVPPAAAAVAALHQNHPNPFNPGTTFRFALAYPDYAELLVLDLRGRRVRTLIAGDCPAGTTEVFWDGTDDDGKPVASGIYRYRLRAAGLQYSRTATLVK